MTMKLIRFGTKRAGFSDWPNYENIPGKDEPHIAKIAYQDPCWEDCPPPRTYKTDKTITGEKIALKIRDMRLRKALTGKTSLPRLNRKTNPKQIEAEQVDFEEEVARYKRGIAKDIQQLKNQAYKAPTWVTNIIEKDSKTQGQEVQKQAVQRNQVQAASSSSTNWEAPISDTQAIDISEFLMTTEEENIFFQEDGLEDSGAVPTTVQSQGDPAEGEKDDAPSWERHWEADAQPAASPDEDNSYWEEWLEDIQYKPRPGYQPFDDILKGER